MSRTAPRLRAMIDALVASPSVSSSDPALDMGNMGVIEPLAAWLEELGLEVRIMPVATQPAKANLIATLGRGRDGLVLAGHTDTVPYDEGAWSSDPFRVREADGRLYGLGTADMKAFLALAVEAVREVDRRRLRRPLVVLATADEETTMAGARALVREGVALGRHAIIGEPTSLRPVAAHKGVMMEGITVHGRAGHSSDPRLGASALEGMQRVMAAILDWRAELQARHRDPRFAVPYPTLNLGHIHGGDNPNRICGECELRLDLRPLPGMDLEALRGTLHAVATQALRGTPLRLGFETLFDGIPALHTDQDAEVLRAAEALTGHPGEAVAFGTEGPYLDRLGIQTVVLGPGDIAQAHQADEYLALERIPRMLEVLHGLIQRLCLA